MQPVTQTSPDAPLHSYLPLFFFFHFNTIHQAAAVHFIFKDVFGSHERLGSILKNKGDPTPAPQRDLIGDLPKAPLRKERRILIREIRSSGELCVHLLAFFFFKLE